MLNVIITITIIIIIITISAIIVTHYMDKVNDMRHYKYTKIQDCERKPGEEKLCTYQMCDDERCFDGAVMFGGNTAGQRVCLDSARDINETNESIIGQNFIMPQAVYPRARMYKKIFIIMLIILSVILLLQLGYLIYSKVTSSPKS